MRDFQNDGGIRWADLLPPNKYIKTSSACGTAPTDYLLNAGRRSQIFKKASQSPQSDVGQKIKIKKERDEGFQNLIMNCKMERIHRDHCE